MATLPTLRMLLSVIALAGVVACENQNTTPPAPYPGQYPQQQYPNGQYPPPNGQYPNGQYPPGGGTVPQPPLPTAQRPLLPALVGSAAMQQEVRAVLNELIASLDQATQAKVRGIPLVFDPTLEINAYAGCDDNGAPFLAGTEGILQAVDAMSQTKATDELFGTQTFEAYSARVVPQLVQSDKASPALPAGLIPAQYGGDARRWSRAHEMFDEIVAFTFGHELGHHYLQHTGCAVGAQSNGPPIANLGRLALRVPAFNQFAEAAADSFGGENALNAGAARRPQYRWSERGGITLLDFFGRLERAAGGSNPLSLLTGFLRTHPAPAVRMPLLQAVAQNWYSRRRDVNPSSQQ